MGSRTIKKYLLVVLLGVLVLGFLYEYRVPGCGFPGSGGQAIEYIGPEHFIMSVDGETGGEKKFIYDRNIPLIFIGGMPRSGTTLLRVMLDAHPDIRCGEETRVIPRILGFRQQWMKAPFESRRLKEAGVVSEVLDSAVASFILEIVAKHGTPAPRLCNKDPFTLRSAVYLRSLFPAAKFIFMIRDGRAVVHSIITRKVTISGFDLHNFRQCIKKWNTAMKAMKNQCDQLGKDVCLPVHYEQLVLNPKHWLRHILNFLNVPWNETVLNHEKFINKPGGISLSKLERSTDQVIKPVNIEALSKWVGQIPKDVVRDMKEIAPMLQVFGYDPNANPPKYGQPDSLVESKMDELKRNRESWEERQRELTRLRESIRSDLLEKQAARREKIEKNKL